MKFPCHEIYLPPRVSAFRVGQFEVVRNLNPDRRINWLTVPADSSHVIDQIQQTPKGCLTI